MTKVVYAPCAHADFRFELAARDQGSSVCGIDEAGRGLWPGRWSPPPSILDPDNIPRGLNDSKKLDADPREALFALIVESAAIGVGIGNEQSGSDRDNILAGDLWAMAQAVRGRSLEAPPRTGRRQPGAQTPLRRPNHRGRRCAVAFDRRRLDHRQGDARPDHGGAA